MLGNSGDGQLKLVLQYLTDQASKEQVVQDAQDVGRKIGSATTASMNDPATVAAVKSAIPGYFSDVPAAAGQAGTQAAGQFREGFSQGGLDSIFGDFKNNFQGINGNIDQAKAKTEDWYSELRKVTREDQMIENLLSTIGTTMAVSGAAIEAGVWGGAAKYVQDATQANAITDTWKNTTNDLGKQADRIGQVMANAVMPQYKQFAEIEKGVADFLQAHPEVAADANMVGELLVGTGAVLKAVSTGIHLVSDVAFIEAMHEHSAAMGGVFAPAVQQHVAGIGMFGTAVTGFDAGVDQFGAEAGMARIGMTAGAPTAATAAVSPMTGAMGTIGTVALLAGSVVLGVEVGENLGNAIGHFLDKLNIPQFKDYQNQGLGDAFVTLNKIELLPFVKGLQALAALDPELTKFSNDFTNTSNAYIDWLSKIVGATHQATITPTPQYQLSEQQQAQFTQAVVKDYEQFYKTQQADAENNANAILQIQQEAYASEQSAAKSNAEAIERIDQSYQNRINNIVASAALQESGAEANYAAQRAQTIRDAGIQIQRAEQDLQNKLYDLQISHNDKLWDLAAKRDALGIVKENESYAQQKSKDIRDTDQQIARDRQDLAIRLEDQRAAFERSEQQRHAQEALQLQEAATQHTQQLAAQQQSYDDQLTAIKDNEDKKLQAQKDAYQKQETALRTSLINQINDEYWSLNSEAKMKNSYYQTMLADAEQFMQQYAAALDPSAYITTTGDNSTGTGSPSGSGPIIKPYDYGGYATTGLYAMAQNGMPEFVLSGQATNAAENIIGGRLTEQALMSRLMMGGNSNSLQYNDMRRFNGDVSVPTRRDIEKGTLELLQKVIKK